MRPANSPGRYVLQVDVHLLDAHIGGDLEGRPPFLDVDFHQAVVHLAGPQFLAQFLPRALDALTSLGLRGHEQLEETVLRISLGALGHLVQALLAHHVDGDVHQVPDHRLDVAAHITHLGELTRLHLEERRAGQLGQPPCQLGLSDAGRPHHEDVLRDDLLGHLRFEFLPPDAVAQGDGHGPLGAGLADHVLVQFADNLPGRELVEKRRVFGGLAGKINNHV